MLALAEATHSRFSGVAQDHRTDDPHVDFGPTPSSDLGPVCKLERKISFGCYWVFCLLPWPASSEY